MSDRLEERLREIEVLGGGPGVERAAAAARSRAEQDRPGKSRGRLGGRRAMLLAAVVLAVAALSPPGQDAARALGDLVGIGDPPSEPFFIPGQANESEVIGVGTTENGTRFELAASTNYEPGARERGVTCVYVSFPEVDGIQRTASCLTRAALGALRSGELVRTFATMGPEVLGVDSDLLITAVLDARVEDVEVTVDGAGDPFVAIGDFVAEPNLRARQTGQGEQRTPLRFMVGFLPSITLDDARIEGDPEPGLPVGVGFELDQAVVERVLDSIRVTGYDSAGEELHSTTVGEQAGPHIPLAISPGGRFAEPGERVSDERLDACVEEVLGGPLEAPAPDEPVLSREQLREITRCRRADR